MVRMTLQTRLVLQALMQEPTQERYGLQLAEVTGLPSGTIYPILARLEQAGWVQSAWEDPTVHEAAGRPRRRFYHLTSDGAEQARDALARVSLPRRSTAGGWVLPAPGTIGVGS